eukprot:174512-Hanusia_phi.AAC.1
MAVFGAEELEDDANVFTRPPRANVFLDADGPDDVAAVFGKRVLRKLVAQDEDTLAIDDVRPLQVLVYEGRAFQVDRPEGVVGTAEQGEQRLAGDLVAEDDNLGVVHAMIGMEKLLEEVSDRGLGHIATEKHVGIFGRLICRTSPRRCHGQQLHQLIDLQKDSERRY